MVWSCPRRIVMSARRLPKERKGGKRSEHEGVLQDGPRPQIKQRPRSEDAVSSTAEPRPSPLQERSPGTRLGWLMLEI